MGFTTSPGPGGGGSGFRSSRHGLTSDYRSGWLPHVGFFVPAIEELGMLDPPLYCKWQEKAGGEDVTGILSLEEDVKPFGCLSAVHMGP